MIHQLEGCGRSYTMVCTPSKPRKIRVVFDCSSQFAGRSLNQELLTGPDLTNPIVGVFTSFRQGEVAFLFEG